MCPEEANVKIRQLDQWDGAVGLGDLLPSESRRPGGRARVFCRIMAGLMPPAPAEAVIGQPGGIPKAARTPAANPVGLGSERLLPQCGHLMERGGPTRQVRPLPFQLVND
jgi:hypothetical protein